MCALRAPEAFMPMFSVAAAEWLHMCHTRWSENVTSRRQKQAASSPMHASKSLPVSLAHVDDDDNNVSLNDASTSEERFDWIDDHSVPLAIRCALEGT